MHRLLYFYLVENASKMRSARMPFGTRAIMKKLSTVLSVLIKI